MKKSSNLLKAKQEFKKQLALLKQSKKKLITRYKNAKIKVAKLYASLLEINKDIDAILQKIKEIENDYDGTIKKEVLQELKDLEYKEIKYPTLDKEFQKIEKETEHYKIVDLTEIGDYVDRNLERLEKETLLDEELQKQLEMDETTNLDIGFNDTEVEDNIDSN